MKKILLIILTLIVVGLISVPNIGQWVIWDDIREIPTKLTDWIDNGNISADSVYVSGNLDVDGTITGVTSDRFIDADEDTYGIAVEDSLKFYVKNLMAMYIDSLYITIQKDLQAQFPMEMLEDNVTSIANTNVSTSSADGDPVGLGIDIDDQKVLYAYGASDGSGSADSVHVVINGGLKVKTVRYTSNTTLTLGVHEIFCDTDGGGFTITLPPGVDKTNYRIINTGSSGNTLTVTPDGTDLLKGANSSLSLGDGDIIIITYETTEGWY